MKRTFYEPAPHPCGLTFSKGEYYEYNGTIVLCSQTHNSILAGTIIVTLNSSFIGHHYDILENFFTSANYKKCTGRLIIEF